MGVLRRILGIFVMIAGILGLLISIAGLVGLWFIRPVLTSSINATIVTLTQSVDTSQQAMIITDQAMDATVVSIDALSEMLGTTAASVEDTQPVLTDVNTMMGKTLPATFRAANDSLVAAEEAAKSLESAIHSLDTFRAVMGATPFLSAFVPANEKPYNPEKPLSDSLGELAVSLEDMPSTFEGISTNMDKADNNLVLIKDNLDTMSVSVAQISTSLTHYQAMIGDSQASMNDLKGMLTSLQNDLSRIINIASAAFGLFFLWLLAAQVVIFSQGWELFQGTAGRMEGGMNEAVVVTTPDPAGID
jgi:hypothetical protein